MYKRCLIVFPVLLISLVVSEAALRLIGYNADYYANSPITRRYIEMNHKRYFYPDSWRLAPGHYFLPLENNKYSEATHDDMGFRITSHMHQVYNDSAAHVFLLGCSFTYGVYMRDSESIGYRLQDSLPGVHVYNLAVPAYGDVQSLISLQQMIQSGFEPKVVILNYSDIHDERNSFNREWQKKLSHERLSFMGISVPCGCMEKGQFEIRYRKLEYHSLPLTKCSVLMNLAAAALNKIIDKPAQAAEVSYQTILAMADVCREIHAQFILTGVDRDDKTIAMLNKCHKVNIEVLDLSDGCTTAATRLTGTHTLFLLENFYRPLVNIYKSYSCI